MPYTNNTITFPLEWRKIMPDSSVIFLAAIIDNLPFSIKDDEFAKILKCSRRTIQRNKKILSKELKILEFRAEINDYLKETNYTGIDHNRLNSLLENEGG